MHEEIVEKSSDETNIGIKDSNEKDLTNRKIVTFRNTSPKFITIILSEVCSGNSIKTIIKKESIPKWVNTPEE